MSKMYESLMTGLMEDLDDIRTYGEPQGRKTVVEYEPVKEYTALLDLFRKHTISTAQYIKRA